MSGDKSGMLAFWDTNRDKALFKAKGHSAVGKISFYCDDQAVNNVVLTAGLTDGRVNVYDMMSG